MQVGDEVWYLPHEVHSRDVDMHGDLAWVFGWKANAHMGGTEVRELDAAEAIRQIEAAKANPQDPTLSACLVRLRVNCPWKARVVAVSEDGKAADLDVCCRNLVHAKHGTWPVTLHYNGVPIVDKSKGVPHSCHEKT